MKALTITLALMGILAGSCTAAANTTYQILLRWHLQSGVIAIPGSTNHKHIAEMPSSVTIDSLPIDYVQSTIYRIFNSHKTMKRIFTLAAILLAVSCASQKKHKTHYP